MHGRAQKTSSNVQRHTAAMNRDAGFPRHRAQGRVFGCLLAFCLLAVLLLGLAVLYLLTSHLREPPACNPEERAGRMPEFQKQMGAPPATELKPRAHLQGLKSNTLTDGPRKFPALQWNNDTILHPNSEVRMKYENGSLVIPKDGDYFVYAQVTFRYLPKKEEKKTKDVTQIISKLIGGYPEAFELLRSTSSIAEKENWNHAIYLGAVVTLQENDKLFVNVSDIGLVYPKRKETFFGAFLI